ncbi:hypothetical protein BH11MYX1_BH11MYX1_46260 [soil metagenome]
MGVLAGSAPLPMAETVVGPQLSVVVGSDHVSLAAEAAAMMATTNRDRGGSLGVVAKFDPIALRRGPFTVTGSLEAIAQHEWWNLERADRSAYGGGLGVAISSPDLRHPGALSRVHLDLRVLVAPHPAETVLARTTEPRGPGAGRDLGVLLVVGGELGALR